MAFMERGSWVNGKWVVKQPGGSIFVDEEAMLAKANFKLQPDELVDLAKAFLISRGGFGADPHLMASDFIFAGPVVGPLSKDAFVSAISSVDIARGFPDFNPEFYGFRVDPFEGNRVWYTARGRGTNTGPLPPFANEPTGKPLVNPPQACSLTFDESGLVTKYTIGYVTDRAIGNTGGLGGLYGSARATCGVSKISSILSVSLAMEPNFADAAV